MMLSADRASSMLDRSVEERRRSLRARGALAIGGVLGAFRVVRPLGAGGMGAVYLAERTDGAYDQLVAIKLFAASPQFESRFRRERAILARLDHPRIARLVDGGVRDGRQPYFVLEYVDGQPLDVYLREHRPSFRARVELFLEICDAVGYAHRNLVVHRDLKPQNILVTKGGHAKLLDFGIAKLLAEDDVLATRTIQSVATPAYAAPEQLTGQAITTATDVWALGALLYQVLSGALPFSTSHGRVALEHAILHDDPPSPRTLAPEIPEDLEAIALAALRKEPEERTPSVEAFADDLRRWIALRPVRARGLTALSGAQVVQRNRPRWRFRLSRPPPSPPASWRPLAGPEARKASAAIAEASAPLARDFLVRLLRRQSRKRAVQRRPRARDMLEKAANRRRGELAQHLTFRLSCWSSSPGCTASAGNAALIRRCRRHAARRRFFPDH